MKIAALTFGVSRTFNLGNFESLRVEASVTIEPDGDDTTDAIRAQALSEIRATLLKEYQEFKRKDAA